MLTPLSASISTPVFPSHRTVQSARMLQLSGFNRKQSFASVRFRRWHIGMSSEQRLQPMIPATCETVSTSPFLSVFPSMASNTSRETRIVPSATALRSVGDFPDTSTMRALPRLSKCVSSLSSLSILIHPPA